jgi:hypothetical protein
MALVSVLKTFQGERYSVSGNKLTYVEVYRVRYNSIETAATAAKASGIPAIGTAATVSSLYTEVSNVEAMRVDNEPYFFDVSVTYETPSNEQPANPTSGQKWNVSVSVSGVPYEENVGVDKLGRDIKNSAGDPFPDGVTKTYWDQEIQISFNSNLVDVSNIDACLGKSNSATVTATINGQNFSWGTQSVAYPGGTMTVGTLKLVGATYSTKIGDDGQDYWDISYTFHYRSDGWVRKVQDMGFKELKGTAPNQTRELIRDDQGNELNAPAFLNGTGGKLAAGGTVVLIPFKIDDTVSFSSLFTGL